MQAAHRPPESEGDDRKGDRHDQQGDDHHRRERGDDGDDHAEAEALLEGRARPDRRSPLPVRREVRRAGDPGEHPGHAAIDDERLQVPPREVVPGEREEEVRDPGGKRRRARAERADELHDAPHPGDDGEDHADLQNDAHRARRHEAGEPEDRERRRGRARRLGPARGRPAEIGRDEVERLRDRQGADEGDEPGEERAHGHPARAAQSVNRVLGPSSPGAAPVGPAQGEGLEAGAHRPHEPRRAARGETQHDPVGHPSGGADGGPGAVEVTGRREVPAPGVDHLAGSPTPPDQGEIDDLEDAQKEQLDDDAGPSGGPVVLQRGAQHVAPLQGAGLREGPAPRGSRLQVADGRQRRDEDPGSGDAGPPGQVDVLAEHRDLRVETPDGGE